MLDIREQYPLFPPECTQRIAAALGIRHPRYRGSTTPVVLTTDFVLTVRKQDNRVGLHAYSVKPSDELRKRGTRRVLDKLELERRYWCALDVPWSLVTELEFDYVRVANLVWLSHAVHTRSNAPLDRLPDFLHFVIAEWTNRRPLADMLERAAMSVGLQSRDDADRLFRYCVWYQLIEVDLRKQLSLRAPVDARVANSSVSREM